MPSAGSVAWTAAIIGNMGVIRRDMTSSPVDYGLGTSLRLGGGGGGDDLVGCLSMLVTWAIVLVIEFRLCALYQTRLP
jgi:K+ transporter